MITGADIKDGTVTTADIRDGTLRTKDLAGTTVARLRGNAGPAGLQGPSEISGWEIVTTQQAVPANTRAVPALDCPVGKNALSADAYWGHHADAVAVSLYAKGGVAFTTGRDVDDNLHLQVVCATVG